MKNKLTSILSFFVGAASGAAGVYIFIKKKYEARFQKDREEMIEYYRKKGVKETKVIEPEEPATEEVSFLDDERTDMMTEARKIADANKYRTQYSNIPPEPVVDESLAIKGGPYIIDSVDFGTMEDYELRTINCYEDGTLTNERDEALTEEEIEEYVGSKNVDALFRIDSDSIYIRNDELQLDYEIIARIGRYADD